MSTWITLVIFIVGCGNLFISDRIRQMPLLRRANEDVEEMAKVAERERIARDLHDVLGHTLSVIALKSELASKLADRDQARAIQEIREVERISRDALTEVRAAVEGYKNRGFSGELREAQQVLASAGCASMPPWMTYRSCPGRKRHWRSLFAKPSPTWCGTHAPPCAAWLLVSSAVRSF